MAIRCTDPILAAPRQLPPPGDFGASLEPRGVVLPAALADALRAQGAVTLLDALSYMQSFPSAVAATLNWGPADVVKATHAFETLLNQQLPGVIPTPRRGVANVLGAMDRALLAR